MPGMRRLALRLPRADGREREAEASPRHQDCGREVKPYEILVTQDELVEQRVSEMHKRLIKAEQHLGRTLSPWQFESALGFLIWHDFMTNAGRGAGKSFTCDFVQAMLLADMEPNEH